MNRLARYGFLGALSALSITGVAACSSDSDDNNNNDNTGGSSNSGGSSSSGGSSNAGGSSSGGSNAGGSNAGGSNAGGSNAGGSNAGGSNAGGSGPGGADGGTACDLSGTGKTRETLPASITANMTLTADKVWTISGLVHVESGATLTVEPCTRIEGTKDPIGVLIITKGSKIVAEGTADQPILFTSPLANDARAAGDWGGVILLGDAATNDNNALIEGLPTEDRNRYGGSNDADDSGSLKYVRIEFAGYQLATDVEVNGLTMGGVGSATDISHVQVSTSLDDCFEWFGGTVNADHLICNGDGDDMFDIDKGYRGTLEHIFGRKRDNPSANPNGFEWDNNGTTASLTPVSRPTVRHATLCGFGADVGVASYGMVLRKGITGVIEDAVGLGFDYGVDLRDGLHGTLAAPAVQITGSTFFDMVLASGGGVANAAETDNDGAFDDVAWFTSGPNTGNGTTDPGFNNVACQEDAGPATTVTGSGKGAFNGGNWMTGMWVSWDED